MKHRPVPNLVSCLRAIALPLVLLASPPSASAQTVGLLREVYTGITGNSLAELIAAPAFPDRPAIREVLAGFVETGPNERDNYGQRLRGFLSPPTSGEYVFWIASDDQSALYLSADEDPANRRLIAGVSGATGFRSWFSEAGQQSAPIRLEAGTFHYFEVLMKEGGGGDHVSVRWMLPGGFIEEPLPASYFLPFGTPLTPPEITRQPASVTVREGESATFLVGVRNSDPLTYQWQRDGTAIPGANRSSLTLPRVAMRDSGARLRCTLSNPLGVVVSEEAILTVSPDQVPPELAAVFNLSPSNVVVRFSEPVSTNTALASAHYALDGGASVSDVRPGADSSEVRLTTSPLTAGTRYTLTVNGVTDRATTPNPMAPDSRISFVALSLVPAAIGRLPVDSIVAPAPGGLDITAVGAGLVGTNDQAHFSHELRAGDFDVEVRLEGLRGGTLFSQAGLMARETLSSGSPFVASVATPSLAGSQFQWRARTGMVAQARGSFPVNYPQTWLRLRRQGTNFTGFASHDGAGWERLGSAGIAMSNRVYVGVMVSSPATNAPLTAVIRDFRDHEPDAPATGWLPDGTEPLGPSSRRTGLVLSEIMYHPSPREDGRRLEFIEVFNSDSVPVELDGYRLSGDADFTFPPGTILPAGGFLLVAQDPGAWMAGAVPEGVLVLGPWSGQLPHDQGVVRLRNRSGAVLLETEYRDVAPWPVAADGAGASLVLARPSYGEGDARAWAASERVGGSPGTFEPRLPDPLRWVRINEVLAHTDDPVLDFVELYHHGPTTVDLSGCVLTDDPAVAKYRVPAGTTLGPGGFIAWDQTQLGFALSSAGEAVFLLNPEGDRVVDAVRFGPQLNGVSSGRTGNGADAWRLLAAPTPGAANRPPRAADIVINEVMYHPPVGDAGEFVELFNRGSLPVHLQDWRFVDGIDFTFTNDLVLAPGEFLVVAADSGYLLSAHPGLDPARVVGNYTGNLRDSGERVALAQPEDLVSTNALGARLTNRVHVVVSEVDYRDGGRWGHWSDGGGSSLELIDPRADEQQAANWADSDERAKAVWTDIDFSGRLELGQGSVTELQAMLLGAGECLLDDVQVLDAGGANLVVNPSFEGGLTGWIAQGNHVASDLGTAGATGQRSLRIRASAGGDNGANRVKTTLASDRLAENSLATLRAKVRWQRGHPDLLLRLKGNYLETVTHLPVPANLGTPGAPNSRRLANAGPAVWEVSHAPVVPAELEDVRVTARVRDPDGVRSVVLKLRYDPSISVFEVPMRDDGREGDVLPNDGLYTGTIPGQAAGVLAAFWVEATDGASPSARATFPAEPAAGECLVRFGDEVPSGSFGTYRLWMTQQRTDAWSEREFMSNEALDGTVVYGTQRAIYNAGARYRGSPFIRPNYNTPTGNLCAYVWTVPPDDELLGSDEFNLDWLEQPGRDPTLQRERLSFWVGEQLGVSASHVRYIQVYVNGVRRGEVYTDSQQPNSDYVRSWFPDDEDGEIYKIDDWFEFNQAVQREFNVDARLEEYRNASGRLHKTRYRWNWERKSNRGLDDDYTSLLDLVEAFNEPDEARYTQRVQELVDLDGWLRPIATRRVVADWDGYGYNRGKNTFAYRPARGGWHLMLWDLDFSLGGGSDGPTTALFFADDPVAERVYQNPTFGRVYLQAINDAIRGPLAPGRMDALMDGNYAAFQGNRVVASSPAPIRSWVASRRDYLARVLATNTAPWSIEVPPDGGWSIEDGVVRLSGTGPIEVRSILVNGHAYPPAWSTRTNWLVEVPLRSGRNAITLAGVDRLGQPVAGAVGSVVVDYAGPDEPPERFVRITEVLPEPLEPDAEFLEIHNLAGRTTYDLSGWRLEGVDFEFPGGTSLAPGAYALVVKDRTVFERVFGAGRPVVGEYAGRLNNGGETVRLVAPGGSSGPDQAIDEVVFDNRLPWPAAALAGGGALQVVDASRDNRRPSNWYAVDAAGYGAARWTFVSVTDRAAAPADSVAIWLAAPGEVHLDDLSLVAGAVPRVGPELLVNGGFEGPLGEGWIADSTAAASGIDAGVQRSGASSLRLVTRAGGSQGSVSLRQNLAGPLVPGQLYTLSFWYLPNPRGAELTVQVAGGRVSQTVGALELPIAAFSPGAGSPNGRPIAAFPDLWINEVLPPNGGAGGGAAWIELFNASGDSVNLNGWFLSSDPVHPGQWTFPAGTRINPGGFLVVAAEGSPAPEGALPSGLRLSAERGSVVLSRTSEGVPAAVDYLHYEGLTAGRSQGSYPDGPWLDRQVFEFPTPGSPNDRSSRPVRLAINEWMSRNTHTLPDPADGDFDDWIELINTGDTAVDLSGYSLTDDLGNPRKAVFPAGHVLAPGAVMLVWADGEPDQNGAGREFHADFALSSGGEEIALFSPGGSVIDYVEFGPQDRDVSDGRVPDGAEGAVVRLENPSPRSVNQIQPVEDLRFVAVQADVEGVRLEWSSVAGQAYQVQFSEDLRLGWINVGSAVLATGPVTGFLDQTVTGASARFYRIRRL